MIALLVVALGAVVAAVGTGVLVARSTNRPRIYSVAWALALFGLAIGLSAAALGYLAGFGGVLFRAMEFGTQFIAPLALVLALVETTGKSLGSRFAMRLAVAGVAVIALVVLGTDPINPDVTFSTAWPDPTKYYQLAPLTVLGLLTLLTAVTAAGTIGVLTVRTRRDGMPRAESRPVMFTALAALAVVLPGLVWLAEKGLSVNLPIPAEYLFALCSTLAAGLIWYAARMAGKRDLSPLAASSASRRDDRDRRAGDDWDDPREHRRYETGEFDQYGSARHDDYGEDRYADSRSSPRYDEPVSTAMYPGLAALAAEAAGPGDDVVRFGEPGEFIHTGAIDNRLGTYDDSGQYDADEVGGRAGGYDEDSGVFYADDTGYGFSRVDPDGGQAPGWDDLPDQRGGDPRGELFGQITIYTLIEGRADEFDRLTEWVVAQVQSKEPDTLVYIVHAVPTAPLQRILYEVYRDRDAHEEHLNRQYVITYEVEQKPFVLATNVIELGLQQAKVSPLPSISAISDLLSESGIDLTGVTRPAPQAPPRVPPVRSAQPGTAMATRPYQRPPALDRSSVSDPRHGDRRPVEPQYPDQQYPDRQHPDRQYPDRRYPDQQYPDQQYPDRQYADPRYADPQHSDPRYGDPRYADPHQADPRYPDSQYQDPQYQDPQYQDPRYQDPQYHDPQRPAPRYMDQHHADPPYDDRHHEDPHQAGWVEIRGEDSRY
ncbi:MAG TPA: antibiotic biosynthesis monooxygenase [Streptosporangiaceae bacterium]|nr:antibiotic biosynthesis monooxygenase [Streptosporangiaceae bacterium]